LVVVVVVVIPFGGENTAHSSYVEARKNRHSNLLASPCLSGFR